MVYNNFVLRSLISIILIMILFVSLQNVNILYVFGILIYSIIFIEIIKNFHNNLLIILVYLFTSLICFNLYILLFYNEIIFLHLIYTVVMFDTACYLFGSLFGKNIIFSKISPKKTYEGFFGGVLFTNLLYFIIFSFFNNPNFNHINILMLNTLILSSFFGDLIQSIFKRKNNLKESSNFLPGHGGFFDRFDSLLFSIIVLFVYQFFFL